MSVLPTHCNGDVTAKTDAGRAVENQAWWSSVDVKKAVQESPEKVVVESPPPSNSVCILELARNARGQVSAESTNIGGACGAP